MGATSGLRTDLGEPDVADVSGLDEVGEGAHGLLDGDGRVEAPWPIDVDVIDPETGQAVGDGVLDGRGRPSKPSQDPSGRADVMTVFRDEIRFRRLASRDWGGMPVSVTTTRGFPRDPARRLDLARVEDLRHSVTADDHGPHESASAHDLELERRSLGGSPDAHPDREQHLGASCGRDVAEIEDVLPAEALEELGDRLLGGGVVARERDGVPPSASLRGATIRWRSWC